MHTDPVVLPLALRRKRHDRFLLVTDAMPSVGTADSYAVGMLGVRLAEAVRMASEVPAEFLGLAHETGRIAAGCRANLATPTMT